MKQVRPKKNLGQHFLVDLNIARRIADTVDACPGLPVLEVGPGMGVMTQYLVEKPRPLKVVEIDRESVAYLSERFSWNVDALRGGEGRGHEGTMARGHEGEGGRGHEGEEFRGHEGTMARGHEDSSAASSILVPPHPRTPVPPKNLAPTSNLAPPSTHPRCIISADFLRMDLHEVFDGQPFVLTGNYPYDISSQIFFKMLDNRDLIPCCTGMIQREVALRMASQPGNKQYGILSVLIQAWYDVEYLFTVEPDVFNPPPKVQSAVIRMTRNQTARLDCDEQLFKRVVKTVFNQRRKMLRVSLRQIFNGDTTASPAFFDHPFMTRRPEQLSIPEFVELTNLVAEQLTGSI